MYYAQAAAQAAEALAFDRAAKLYRLALELRPGDEAEARRLRMGLADALANAGRGPEAAREYLAAAAGATVAETLERRRAAAMQFLISGHLDEGLAQLECGPESGRDDPSEHAPRAIVSLILNRIKLRLRGLHFRPRDAGQISAEDLTRIDVCWTAASGLGIIDPIRGADFQARGLLLALRAGEPYRIGRALVLEAGHVCDRRRAQQAPRRQARASWPRRSQSGSTIHILRAGVFLAQADSRVSDRAVEAGGRVLRPGQQTSSAHAAPE